MLQNRRTQNRRRRRSFFLIVAAVYFFTTLLVGALQELAFKQIPRMWLPYQWLALPLFLGIGVLSIAFAIVFEVYQLRQEQEDEVRTEPPESPPFNVPSPQPHAFVGRDELRHELKQLLLADAGSPGIVLDLLPGVGKSELAIRLAWDEEVRRHFDGGVLWADLGKKPDIPTILSKWASELGIEKEEMNNKTTIDEKKGAILDAIGERRILMLIDDVWEADDARDFILPEDKVPNCAYLITTRRTDIATDLITGENFRKMVPELSESDRLKLLKRQAGEVVKEPPQQEAKELVRMVGGLPLALVLVSKYLRERVGLYNNVNELLSNAAKEFWRADKLLNLRLERQQIRDRRLPEEKEHTVRAVIEISVNELDDDSTRTFWALSIFQPKPHMFTEDAALKVLDTPKETLRKLVAYGLLEKASIEEALGAEAESNKPVRYWLQRTIAEYARSHLQNEEAEELHRRAAEYYAEQLAKYQERQDITSYRRWYRYEDPEWQDIKAKRLYHLDHTQNCDEARLDFAQVYFDAFWWWGCYLDFPFCEQLLTEWEQTRTSSEDDRELLRLLREFHDSYLTGYERLLKDWEQTQTLSEGDREWLRKFHHLPPVDYKKNKEHDWSRVGSALVDLRSLTGLNGQVSELDEDQRHLRAITDTFLAHAHRYRGAYDEADKCFEGVLDHFRQAGEDNAWNIPWILCEQGDLYMERRLSDEALEKCRETLVMTKQVAEGDQDREVIALSHRIRADAFWQQNNLDRAFKAYAYAAFYAYAVHGTQKPDPYTVSFHREMVGRTLVRLRTLWNQGKRDETVQYSVRLHEFWKLYWDTVGEQRVGLEVVRMWWTKYQLRKWWTNSQLKDLAAYLFPSEPREEDLKAPHDYVEQVNGVYKGMVEQVDEDP